MIIFIEPKSEPLAIKVVKRCLRYDLRFFRRRISALLRIDVKSVRSPLCNKVPGGNSLWKSVVFVSVLVAAFRRMILVQKLTAPFSPPQNAMYIQALRVISIETDELSIVGAERHQSCKISVPNFTI